MKEHDDTDDSTETNRRQSETYQFRAVCRTCGEKYNWRDSYERANRDRENHEITCRTLAGVRDGEYVRPPDLTFETRWGDK